MRDVLGAVRQNWRWRATDCARAGDSCTGSGHSVRPPARDVTRDPVLRSLCIFNSGAAWLTAHSECIVQSALSAVCLCMLGHIVRCSLLPPAGAWWARAPGPLSTARRVLQRGRPQGGVRDLLDLAQARDDHGLLAGGGVHHGGRNVPLRVQRCSALVCSAVSVLQCRPSALPRSPRLT